MKILFVCTHNRCRSILSEAITNHFSNGEIIAKSAGSQPVGEVHPLSLKYLTANGIATDDLRSQSWDEFASFDPDLVITVCDSAAGETCPLWMGNSNKLHWGLSDPSKVEGTDAQIAEAFENCIAVIKQRTQIILELSRKHISVEQVIEQLRLTGAKT